MISQAANEQVEINKFWDEEYFETLVQLFLYDFQLTEQLLLDKTNETYHQEISEELYFKIKKFSITAISNLLTTTDLDNIHHAIDSNIIGICKDCINVNTPKEIVSDVIWTLAGLAASIDVPEAVERILNQDIVKTIVTF